MGKYRFRLSDMMPNAWFYKLKDMGKSRSNKPNSRVAKSIKQSSPTQTQTAITSATITKFQNPKSSFVYYPTTSTAEPLINRFTDPLYSSPRNHCRISDAVRSSSSPSRKTKRTTIYKQNYQSSDQPIYYSLSSSEQGSPEFSSKPYYDHHNQRRKSIEFGAELLMFDELGSWSSSSCSCSCRISSSTADIIIDLNHHNNNDHHHHHEDSFSKKFQKLNEFDAASELELRPILTKIPDYKESAGKDQSHVFGNYSKNAVRKMKSRRSSLSDSFAIVKSSLDPQKDFKDSMMEMIVENNMKGFKDLEELLACYLSLNCKEYHPLIINAFEQIWLDVFCSK